MNAKIDKRYGMESQITRKEWGSAFRPARMKQDAEHTTRYACGTSLTKTNSVIRGYISRLVEVSLEGPYCLLLIQ